MLNNLNIKGLQEYATLVTAKPEEAISSYGIVAKWKGGVHTEISTLNQKLGSKEIIKNFKFNVGEPEELLGTNEYPTPQDYLLGGLAGCMMVGFVILASNKGIQLDSVELKIQGDLNLRGMLEIDEEEAVGFKELQFRFDVKGTGTQADYDEIIKHVQKISPNYRTIADTVQLTVNNSI